MTKVFSIIIFFLVCHLASVAQLNDTLLKAVQAGLSKPLANELVVVTQQQMNAKDAFDKGMVLNNEQKFEEAILQFNMALRIDESGNCGSGFNGSAYNELAYTYTRLFKKDSALYTLHQSIKVSGDNPKPSINKALLLLNMKQKDEAIKTLDSLIVQMPSFKVAIPLRAALYQLSGDYQHAIDDFTLYLNTIDGTDESSTSKALNEWVRNSMDNCKQQIRFK